MRIAARHTTQAKSPPPAETGYSDDTGPRILAYLSSMRPLRGVGAGEFHEYRNAVSAITQLALSAEGTDSPTHELTREQAADILMFMRLSEPVEPKSWWRSPDDAPCQVVGDVFVLDAVENTLRASGIRRRGRAVRS
jgi:hypothetical protein